MPEGKVFSFLVRLWAIVVMQAPLVVFLQSQQELRVSSSLLLWALVLPVSGLATIVRAVVAVNEPVES